MLWLLKRLFYGAELPKWSHHLTDAFGWRSVRILDVDLNCRHGVFPSFIADSYSGVVQKVILMLLQERCLRYPADQRIQNSCKYPSRHS